MPIRALISLHQSSHTDGWAERHRRGEVPDARPYGLHRLAAYDVEPVWPDRPRGGLETVDRAVARVLGVRLVEAWLASGRGIDARLCWDERTGIPAALDPRRKGLPIVSGVIWATAEDGSRRVRSLLRCAFGNSNHTLFTLCREQLAGIRALTAAAVEYVPFGVDADFWTPEEVREPKGRLVVSAGNDRHRDHMTLVRATLRDPGSRLVIATSAVLPEDERLESAPKTHRELRALYRQANVVAVSTFPNDHCSGITAILEAMACARPVVATATAGMDDYVEHGVTGLLVPPGDADALAEALGSLLDDPARADAMGIAGAKRVGERFTTEHMSATLSRLLHEALARVSRVGPGSFA